MKNKKLIESVRTFNPLLQAYEAGYTKAEIMESIYDALSPEFEHQDMLERYGLDLLTVESINVSKVKMCDWASRVYSISLKARREFLAGNKEGCADICSQWEDDIGRGLSLYQNAARFEYHKSNLSLDEFAYEALRNIGSVIEGTFQVYLKELLHLTSSAKGEAVSYAEIKSLSLGNVISRLSNNLGCPDLLTISPWMVPLNQWRNIAQHFSVDTDGEIIICKYGARSQHSITLTRKELFDITRSVVLLFSAVRTSQAIFFLDNADELMSHCKGFRRTEADLSLQFFTGASSQGFEVTGLNFNHDKAFADFKDVTDDDSPERALHALQFVYQLWLLSKSEKLELKYEPKSKERSYIATAMAGDCEETFNGKKQFSNLYDVIGLHIEERI